MSVTEPTYSPREVSEYLLTPLDLIEGVIEDLGLEYELSFKDVVRIADQIPDKMYYAYLDPDTEEPTHMTIYPPGVKEATIAINPSFNQGMPVVTQNWISVAVLFRRIVESMYASDDGTANLGEISEEYDVSTDTLNDVLNYTIDCINLVNSDKARARE